MLAVCCVRSCPNRASCLPCDALRCLERYSPPEAGDPEGNVTRAQTHVACLSGSSPVPLRLHGNCRAQCASAYPADTTASASGLSAGSCPGSDEHRTLGNRPRGGCQCGCVGLRLGAAVREAGHARALGCSASDIRPCALPGRPIQGAIRSRYDSHSLTAPPAVTGVREPRCLRKRLPG